MYEGDRVLDKGTIPGKRNRKHKIKEENKDDDVKEPCESERVPRGGWRSSIGHTTQTHVHHIQS